MSRYAIITGDTEHAADTADIESVLENGELITLSAEEDVGDDVYEDLKSCTAVLGLGELDESYRERLREVHEEAGVPILSDQDYSGFQPVDYTDIMVHGIAEDLERAPDVQKAEQVKEVISSRDDLAIVIHRDPDPDAMSSAYAFQQLSEHYNVDADIYFSGDITHQENRSLVNKIDMDLKELDTGRISDYDGVALLDTGITNSGLIDPDDVDGEDITVDIVIDHHPGWDEYEDHVGEFFDVQRDRGSTASIVSDYYRLLNVEPERDVATALLHGTRTDTNAFDPNKNTFTVQDLENEVYLHQYADISSLAEIVQSRMSEETADVKARAIQDRTSIGETTQFSYVGDVTESDALTQAADELIKIKGVETAIVAGAENNGNTGNANIRVSARSRDIELDLGKELKETIYADPTFEQFQPKAGGTGGRAAAYIPILFDADMDIDDADKAALHRTRRTWLENLFTDLGRD